MVSYSFTQAAIALIAGSASFVAAAPAKRTSCTFTTLAEVTASKTSCTEIILDGIAVPAGKTLDLTGLTSGTSVVFEGETTFGYEEWSGPMISVSGTNIKVSGASGHSINANGAAWWDGEGSNGGKTKPKFFYAHSLKGTSSITGLSVKNTPVQAFSINSSEGLTLTDITIDNSDGDAESDGETIGHNTDAFDVGSSSNINIIGANIQNQDDCLAINSGTTIKFSGGTCSGGHGLSIGSVGGRSDNTVSGVTIESSTVKNSANGVRIKTISGATGTVEDVTYSGITLENITEYGIVIEQDYENGSPTGTPTTGVPITGLTIKDVTGTTTSDAEMIYILCGSGACSDWTWSAVDITGGKSSSSCKNVPSVASC